MLKGQLHVDGGDRSRRGLTTNHSTKMLLQQQPLKRCGAEMWTLERPGNNRDMFHLTLRASGLRAAVRQVCTMATKTPTPNENPLRPPPESHSIATMGGDSDLDAIFQQKRAIRTKVRKELRGMNPTQRSEEDAAIQNIVMESSWFKSSERLCAYISCSTLREVDTLQILSEILSDQNIEGHAHIKKKLYVPRVEDKNSYMRMLNISSTGDLIANTMHILEPSGVDSDGNQCENVMEANEPVDLIILPGLAFDRSGRRLGRSGGYYDMFLTKYQELSLERKWKQPLLVALSYSLQILDDGVIPITSCDVPVDALVSPSGVIPISPTAKERM